MKKILLICKAWPELSQTYIRNEVNALLESGIEVSVLCPRLPRVVASDAPDVPVYVAGTEEQQRTVLREVAPDWIHAHYITMAPLACQLAQEQACMFSVRTHSFDVLGLHHAAPRGGWWLRSLLSRGHNRKYRNLTRAAGVLANPQCAAVFCYPFGRERLRELVPEERLVDYFPLVDLPRFGSEAPARETTRVSVCNVGAASRKKNMPDFFRLAEQCPDMDFHLYMIGYDSDTLLAAGRHIPNLRFHPNIPSEQMPVEYAKHDWLVYTACPRLGTVGWPLAVAEAQASGVGICLPELRPDMRDYAGEQAHYYRDILELTSVICQRPSAPALRAGRELALRCDSRANAQSLCDRVLSA